MGRRRVRAGAAQGLRGGSLPRGFGGPAREEDGGQQGITPIFLLHVDLLLGRLQSEGNRFSCNSWRNICCSLAQHLLQLVGVYSLSAHYAVGSQALRSTLHPIT
jgi:hypothetical protein